MKKRSGKHCAICRKSAGLTQEVAAFLIGVSTRTLSAYERGEIKVPDSIIAEMAKKYNTPLLVWWHLRKGPFKDFIPEIDLPITEREMAFQIISAHDDLEKSSRLLKFILADGCISQDEEKRYKKAILHLRSAMKKILSANLFSTHKTVNRKAC